MSSINKVIILGNVGNDPEMKYAPSGTAMCRLSIATNMSWKDKETGEKRDKTEWHNVMLFRQQAELAEKYVKKGSRLYIEGRIETSKYEKDGIERYSTSIIADRLQFMGNANQNTSEGNSDNLNISNQENKKDNQIPKESNSKNDSEFDDDIPF